MKTYIYPLIIAIFFIACNKEVQKTQIGWGENTYYDYKQFCLYNNFCTDSLLVSLYTVRLNGNIGMHKIKNYTKEEIERINPTQENEDMVVNHFLKSLEVYNLCSHQKDNGGLQEALTLDDFFKPTDFKQNYRANIGKSLILIENIAAIDSFDFYRTVEEHYLENGNVELTFGNFATKMICDSTYYVDEIFPKYLNFISENHKLTPYNLGINKKVNIKERRKSKN